MVEEIKPVVMGKTEFEKTDLAKFGAFSRTIRIQKHRRQPTFQKSSNPSRRKSFRLIP